MLVLHVVEKRIARYRDFELKIYSKIVGTLCDSDDVYWGNRYNSNKLGMEMSLLFNHPEILKKVKVEIDSQVEHGRLINDMDLAKLPYLRFVLSETLRLYPTSPLLLPHFSSTDCSVGRYHTPQGTILLVNVFFMNRDPKVCKEPTMFKPERFEVIKGEKEGFKFIPFGIGRKACPGGFISIGSVTQCFEKRSYRP